MESKSFQFLGHNCFLFETEKSYLITDPWFSSDGAFFGSWFQYPKNHHLLEDFLKLSFGQKKLFIYLSHEHQDHFDIQTLRKLNKNNVEMIIPKFEDNFLKVILSDEGFHVNEIEALEKVALDNSLKIKIYVSDIGINHDSAALIEWNNLKFFNQNDCKIFEQLSSLESEAIDYYSVQFSGATWHPSCFAFSDKRKKLISEKKVLTKLKNVVSGINTIKPKYYIPAAGPAIFPFLEESLSEGKENIFIHQDYLDKYLKSNGINNTVYLRPGDYFDESLVTPILPPTSEEIEKYRVTLESPWEKNKFNFQKKLLQKEIQLRLDQIKDLSMHGIPIIIFQWGESPVHKIIVDLNTNSIKTDFDETNPYIKLIASEEYFSLMHSKFRWQDIYLSLRAQVVRRPDVFNNIANIFIFSDLSNIKKSMESTLNISNERIEVKIEKDLKVSFDRFCPHQGADLCNAEIDKNLILKCPRHGWEFDLKNNGINIESNERINAELIVHSKD